MFRSILAGYDGSENGATAVKTAARLAASCGAELMVITVYRHHSLLEASLSMVRPGELGNLDDAMREYATGIVEKAKEIATDAGATNVRGFVKSGPVARSIVGFAANHGVDLIVVGSRGLGSVEQYLLGSVSHKISGIADCPVLVV
jgi:nucleotide-binding universal stress UspA family protein